MEKSKLQTLLYSKIKPLLFTASTAPKILNKIQIQMKKENRKKFEKIDIIKTILLDEDLKITLKHSIKSKKKDEEVNPFEEISKILELIAPKIHNDINYKKFNLARIKKDRKKVINSLFDQINKGEKEFPLQNYKEFAFIINMIITRISKDIKLETLKKFDIELNDNDELIYKNIDGHNDIIYDTDIISLGDDNLIGDDIISLSVSMEDYYIGEDEDISLFRETLIDNMLLSTDYQIQTARMLLTNEYIKETINKNFNNDINFALTSIRGETQFKNYIQKDIDNIPNINLITEDIYKTLKDGKEIVIITDSDNDGKSGFAAIEIFKKSLPEEYSKLITVKMAEIIPYNKTKNGINNNILKKEIIKDIDKIELIKLKENIFENLIKNSSKEVNKELLNFKIDKIYKKFEKEEDFNKELDELLLEFFPKDNISHGMNKPQLENLISSKEINPKNTSMLITVDNGMSLNNENIKDIQNLFDKDMIFAITDHHLTNDNTADNIKNGYIVNPKHNPQGIFKTNINISGAQTFIEPLIKLTKKLNDNLELKFNTNIKDILRQYNNIIKYSNLNDIVTTIIPLLPLQEDKEIYAQLGTKLNIMNGMKSFFTTKDLTIKEIAKSLNMDIKESSILLKELNTYNNLAKNYLELYQQMDENYTKSKLHVELSNLITNFNDNESKGIDYISLLSPYIIELTAKSTSITPEESMLLEKFLELYDGIAKIEKKILKQISEEPTYFIENYKDIEENKDNSQIYIMRKNDLINRKLLAKVFTYPNNNNSIIAIIDSNLKGSARTLVDKNIIFKDIDGIELAGHSTAFGLTIDNINGNKTKQGKNKKVKQIMQQIDQNTKDINFDNDIENNNYVVGTENVALIQTINSLTGGGLTDKNSLKLIIKLDKYEIELLEKELIDNPTKQYFKLDTKIMENSLIIPKGKLKKYIKLNKNGEDVSLVFNNMSNNASIAEKVIDSSKLRRIEKDKKQEIELQKHIDKRDGYSEELTREDFKKLFAIVYDVNGETKFKRMEALLIQTIDNLELGAFNILDVEATLMGKLHELGVVELKIDENSGINITNKKYEEESFMTYKGNKEVLIPKSKSSKFKILKEDELENLTQEEKLFVVKNNKTNEYYLNEKQEYFDEIYSKIKTNKGYKYNLELKGTHNHFLLKDFIIETAISQLTGLSNDLAQKNGIKIKELDEILSNIFEKQGNFIFSAHNAGFDLGVILKNLPKTSKIIEEKGIVYNSMTTATSAMKKSYKYASINLENFASNLPKKLNFYNYIGNGYSLQEFLINKKEGSLIKSYDERYKLEIKNNNLIVHTKKEKIIILKNLDKMDKETILSKMSFVSDSKGSTRTAIHKLSETLISLIVSGIDENRYKETIIPKNLIDGIDISNIGNDNRIFVDEMKMFFENYRFNKTFEENLLYFEIGLNEKKDLKIPLKDIVIQKMKDSNLNIELEFEKLSINNSNLKLNKAKQITTAQSNKFYNILYDEFMDKLEKQTEKFLENNTAQTKVYSELVEIEMIGHYFPESLKDVTEERIKKISKETTFPIERIKEVLKLYLDFEEKNNVNLREFYEVHNNVIATQTKGMGDNVSEGFIVLLKLIDSLYNTYSKNTLQEQVYHHLIRAMINDNKLLSKSRESKTLEGKVKTINSSTTENLLNSDNEDTSFIQKHNELIEKGNNEFFLKLKNGLLSNGSVVKIKIDDIENIDIDNLVKKIEFFAFLRNLNNSKESIKNNISQLFESNSSNFKQNFNKYFRTRETFNKDENISSVDVTYFDYLNSNELLIVQLKDEIKELKYPGDTSKLLQKENELKELLNSKVGINNFDLVIEEVSNELSILESNLEDIKEDNLNKNIYEERKMKYFKKDYDFISTKEQKLELLKASINKDTNIKKLIKNIKNLEKEQLLLNSIFNIDIIKKEISELKKHIDSIENKDELEIDTLKDRLKDLTNVKKEYENEIKNIDNDDMLKLIELVKITNKKRISKKDQEILDIPENKLLLTNSKIKIENIKNEINDNKNQIEQIKENFIKENNIENFKLEIEELKDNLNQKIKKYDETNDKLNINIIDISDYERKISELSFFLIELNKMYDKSLDLHKIDKIMSNFNSIDEINFLEQELVNDYNLIIDTKEEKYFKEIDDELRNYLIELFDVEVEFKSSVDKKYSKIKRGISKDDKIYMDAEKLIEFKTKLYNDFENEIDKLHLDKIIENPKYDIKLSIKQKIEELTNHFITMEEQPKFENSFDEIQKKFNEPATSISNNNKFLMEMLISIKEELKEPENRKKLENYCEKKEQKKLINNSEKIEL